MNILISRLRPNWAEAIAKNLAKHGHSVHTIDHGQLEDYERAGAFKSCHLWKWINTPQEELEEQFRRILGDHGIDLVIIAQKLFLYSNVAEKVCREVGVRMIFTEYFFDDKLIWDDVGLQYTQHNQSVGSCDLPVDWPLNDREPQPIDKSMDQLLSQYDLSDRKKIVVIYGQLLWDMSLVQSPESIAYDEYIHGLCTQNPDTIFLFKPHPKDHWKQPNSSKYSYDNMIRVNESLRTLFQFDAHTAFSSTVIFEGVSQGLRFASCGYHLLQHHTHRITRDGFSDIYNKIMAHSLNMQAITRAASYITNLYTLSMHDPFLAHRLEHGLDQKAREHVLAS